MRIVHIVTLADPEGSLGGPLRVACNQIAALRDLGHDAVLVAAGRGFPHGFPTEYGGVPAHLYRALTAVPGTGFAGVTSPGMVRALKPLLAETDVAHIHLARDLVQLPAALRCRQLGVPYVAQTHGMIDLSSSPLAPPLDVLATRPALRSAARILALTEREKADLLDVDPSLSKIDILPNGVPTPDLTATHDQASVEVMFLARMAPRKRPRTFVAMAQKLATQFPDARFTLIGPDEGEVPSVRTMINENDADGRIRYDGALQPDAVAARLAKAAVYVLPAENEPFGMSVVEAMSVGVPTAVMADCGLANTVRATNGVVARDDTALTEGVAQLLRDPTARETCGELGKRWVREKFGMADIATRLVEHYSNARGERK